MCHSRGNLGLQEDEDEDEQCWHTAGEHHPDGEILFFSRWVNEPASDIGVGHLKSFGHNQFLKRTIYIISAIPTQFYLCLF